ncbi:hypothetical protein [Heyndrickxia acidiproducens]|jgi:hypothetical protein|uniref:hypothetical protein n=1 Tax=Heyndrickxia acidiproducens TaxID=1121084 RepID=UPI00037DA2FF|nr:hypothetical protein [Heyndrickxia acidiproducens]
MDLKKYYLSMSKVYFNQTVILALALSVFCLALVYLKLGGVFNYMILSSWAFILYNFDRYLFYTKIEKQINPRAGRKTDCEADMQYMIHFLPEARFSMQLFDSSGTGKWLLEEKAVKRKTRFFTLQDCAGGGTYAVRMRQNRLPAVAITYQLRKMVFQLQEKSSRHFMLSGEYGSAVVEKNGNKEIEIYWNGNLLAVATRGFMPVAWQEIFPPNTPVLRFAGRPEKEEMVLVFAFLTFFYVHDKYFV